MKKTKWLGLLLVVALLASLVAACGGATPTAAPTAAPTGHNRPAGAPPAPTKAPNPVDAVEIKAPVTITFWHTQSAGRETALKQIVADFTKANPNITVNLEYINGYTDLYKKMMASIQAGAMPDMAVSYESMIADYAQAKIVVALDDYVNSTKYGLTQGRPGRHAGRHAGDLPLPGHGQQALHLPLHQEPPGPVLQRRPAQGRRD